MINLRCQKFQTFENIFQKCLTKKRQEKNVPPKKKQYTFYEVLRFYILLESEQPNMISSRDSQLCKWIENVSKSRVLRHAPMGLIMCGFVYVQFGSTFQMCMFGIFCWISDFMFRNVSEMEGNCDKGWKITFGGACGALKRQYVQKTRF